MDLANPSWIPTIILLATSIAACYFDLKRREMPVGFWLPVFGLCLPPITVLYLFGYYPWYLLLLGVGFTLLYLALAMRGLYAGADFWFLAAISLFFVENPVTGHVLMPISFAIFFLAAFVGFSILCQVPAIKERVKTRGFPTMVTISLALWLTVAIA